VSVVKSFVERALVAALLATVSACGSGNPSPSATAALPSNGPAISGGAPATTLTIFGAASLKGVLDRAKVAYAAVQPGTTLTISTDSSAALETQIEQGAPADLFLSADTTNPKRLVDKGLTAGDAVAFTRNELTVIVPTANPAAIRTPADLARRGVKIVAAGDAVPITAYAQRLVANLATEPGYPADFAAAVAANIVSKEDNVKSVLAKIELGEGDAGIVYITDATSSRNVRSIAVPSGANVPATYAGVVLKTSSDVAAARRFLVWLTGPDGQAILSSVGFLPPS